MKTCQGLVIGSPYSRKGTNQFVPCEHPAKFHVKKDYSQTGGQVWEEDVCGVHVREARKLLRLFKDNRILITEIK